MEATSIIAGIGVIHSLLLLLTIPIEENMSVEAKKEYDDLMKLKSNHSNSQRTKDLIQFVADDKFSDGVLKIHNIIYMPILRKLKETFVKFYFKRLEEIDSKNMDLEIVADIDSKISNYLLQLMRLRLVIQPEIQISTNVHPRTEIHYLAVKAYWIDDEGKKVRKFTKSLGRAENYPGGIEDKKALKDALTLIQPVLYDTYKSLYPE